MNRNQFEEKSRVIRWMCSTAIRNGRPHTFYSMTDVADRLHKIETTLSRLAEEECEYEHYDSVKQESREKKALEIITKEIGCKAYTQRDPRGYCIRMYLVDDNGDPVYNSWDGETTGLAW